MEIMRTYKQYKELAEEIKKERDYPDAWDELLYSFVEIRSDLIVKVVWITEHFIKISYPYCNCETTRILPRFDLILTTNDRVLGIRGYHVGYFDKRYLVSSD